MRRPGWMGAGCVVAATLMLGACELDEITLVEAEDVVVADVYVQLGPDGVVLRAFLHRTLGSGGDDRFRPVPGALVSISRSDGLTLELAETDPARCVRSLPEDGDGTCYWAAPEAAGRLAPGDRLTLDIRLPDGGVLQSATSVPSDFALSVAGARPSPLPGSSSVACRLTPDTPLDLRWTRSDGAWAYINETQIFNLGAALAEEGIAVEEDPLYLLGLSISTSDTAIVFPGEFGVFNRFELEQDVAVRLQRGLPDQAAASVTIAAVDRNYVNWVRGGNFNPSGQVRVPSVRGDGTGVFAASVWRKLDIVSTDSDVGLPACSVGD